MNNPWGPPGQQPYNQGQQPPPGGYGQQPQYGQQQQALWGNAPPNGPYRADAPVYMRPNEDESTLKVLSILNYVYAGLVGMVGLLYGGFGILMACFGAVSNAQTKGGQDMAPFLTIEGIMFGVIAAVAVVFAVLHVMVGRKMTKRTNYTFLIVMACVSLLSMPFGTLLGAFTLVTLNKPGVKAIFNRA